jgi:Cu/Ag efflux pump CusA
MASSPNVIRREGISPYLDIVFTVQGRNARTVIGDAQAAIQNFNFPLEYHGVVLDDYATRQASQQRIFISIIVGVCGILLFLQAAFRSWRLALVGVLTLPMALAGGVLAAILVSGGLFSLVSLAGLLTIMGISLRNTVMLIGRYQHLELQENQAFGPELVLLGSRERVAPILMTVVSLGLALLPFALSGNIPGHEVLRPIASIILGGLVTSTLLNLFVIPSLYLRFGANAELDPFSLPISTQPGLSSSSD